MACSGGPSSVHTLWLSRATRATVDEARPRLQSGLSHPRYRGSPFTAGSLETSARYRRTEDTSGVSGTPRFISRTACRRLDLRRGCRFSADSTELPIPNEHITKFGVTRRLLLQAATAVHRMSSPYPHFLGAVVCDLNRTAARTIDGAQLSTPRACTCVYEAKTLWRHRPSRSPSKP